MVAPFAGKWIRTTDQSPPWKPSDNAWKWIPIKVKPKFIQLFCRHRITYFAPPSERYCEKCGKYITTVIGD